jgi:UDP-glucose-4-epimerase GalE
VRVLVTGGAGYIGSQTVRLLVRRGHEPVVIDTLEHGYRESIGETPFVLGSIADRALVRDVIASHGIEAVVHFAALKDAGASMTDPALYLDRNVGDSLALLAEVDRASLTAFVFSSSAAVYGEPERSPVAEDAATRPENPYGESKLLVERALPWYGRRGLRHVSLRYFNAAGAESDGSHGEDPAKATNLVPLVARAAVQGGPPVAIFGTDYPTPDGTAIRDYVHVADLADAHIRALEYLAGGGQSVTLNLGTGRGSSVREVIAAAERAAGRRVPVVETGRRPGDPVAIWADAGRAASALGWRAASDLDDIVTSAVLWQVTHPAGYGPGAATSASAPTAARAGDAPVGEPGLTA